MLNKIFLIGIPNGKRCMANREVLIPNKEFWMRNSAWGIPNLPFSDGNLESRILRGEFRIRYSHSRIPIRIFCIRNSESVILNTDFEFENAWGMRASQSLVGNSDKDILSEKFVVLYSQWKIQQGRILIGTWIPDSHWDFRMDIVMGNSAFPKDFEFLIPTGKFELRHPACEILISYPNRNFDNASRLRNSRALLMGRS